MDHQENSQRDPEMTPENDTSEENIEAAEAAEAVEPELSPSQWLRRNWFFMAVVAVLLVAIYQWGGFTAMFNIAKVVIGVSLMIFVHELGHYLVAKWCGVKVEVFSIGFGPAIPGCRFQWGETNYKLAIFPLGGYVQMLGQVDLHEEDDPSDLDPRSYKNKAVWQRMAIISAGVVMNLIFGLVLYVLVFMGPGQQRMAAVVPWVDSNSPSFTNNVRTGAKIDKVGTTENPYFNTLVLEVLYHHVTDQKLPFEFHRPGEKRQKLLLTPHQDEVEGRPMIGVGIPAPRLIFAEERGAQGFTTPTGPNSPASRAEPAFKFGDEIIATTDPDSPDKLKELPIDTRVPKDDVPNYGQRDYFVFAKRMMQLAGENVTLKVQRGKSGETVEIRVPPAYHRTFGAVMGMGEITSLRNGSPAEKEKIEKRDKSKNREGDVIERVEVTEPDGTVTRFSHFPEKMAREITSSRVRAALLQPTLVRGLMLHQAFVAPRHYNDVRLDPVRLPDQLKAWAGRMAKANQPEDQWHVTLLVKRHNRPEKTPDQYRRIEEKLRWDNNWRYDIVRPVAANSPMPIPELGLGYQIATTVAWVDPKFQNGLPEKEGDRLRAGDVIESCTVHTLTNQEGNKTSKTHDVSGEGKQNHWAAIAANLHSASITKLELMVNRNGESRKVEVALQNDKEWPRWRRGLVLQVDRRLQVGDGIIGSAMMGIQETWNKLSEVFLVLRGMLTGKLSSRNIGGPVLIAQVAYQFAEFDIWQFISFIAFISINLAVINSLPIPILDGGHMVFLIYELIRGKPASENVRVAALYAGLLIILLIFVFVMYLDITRLFS